MIGFRFRWKGNNYVVLAIDYRTGIVTGNALDSFRDERIATVPLEEVAWCYSIPDSNGFVGRYYGFETVPFGVIGRWREYYPQSSGAGFIGEGLIDMSPEDRSKEWAKGTPFIY